MKSAMGVLALLGGFVISPSFVQAEGFLDRLMDRATQSLESAVSQQVDKTLNKAMDKLDDCLSTDQKCAKSAKDQGNKTTVSSPSSAPPAGQLTASNAPAHVEGKFVPDPTHTTPLLYDGQTMFAIRFVENYQNAAALQPPYEGMSIDQDPALNYSNITYKVGKKVGSIAAFELWQCVTNVPTRDKACPGLAVNRSAGTVTFSNVVLEPWMGQDAKTPITLNGTLRFTPF